MSYKTDAVDSNVLKHLLMYSTGNVTDQLHVKRRSTDKLTRNRSNLAKWGFISIFVGLTGWNCYNCNHGNKTRHRLITLFVLALRGLSLGNRPQIGLLALKVAWYDSCFQFLSQIPSQNSLSSTNSGPQANQRGPLGRGHSFQAQPTTRPPPPPNKSQSMPALLPGFSPSPNRSQETSCNKRKLPNWIGDSAKKLKTAAQGGSRKMKGNKLFRKWTLLLEVEIGQINSYPDVH